MFQLMKNQLMEGGIFNKMSTVDEQSAGKENIQQNSTVDEKSAGKEKGSSLSDDEKSSDSESGSKESQVKMTRRGRAVKPPSHLRDYKL